MHDDTRVMWMIMDFGPTSNQLFKSIQSKVVEFGWRAMATNISVLQPNGELLVLEVTPEITGRELKQQIKEGQPWDELTRSTTSVEIIVGDDHLLANDAKVLDAGITQDTVVGVVFKPNIVVCSHKDMIARLGGIVDSKLLLVVELPNHETHIHAMAFAWCHTLAKLTIPDSVTHIGNGAFQNCSSLANLTLPNSVTHIGVCAFQGCSSLANLTISESVTHIGNGAFQECSALASLTIPNSVTHIGHGAFQECCSLASLTIPNSVTHIGNYAFAGCSSLANLTIPSSVNHIGNGAFQRCSSLANLTIPNSATHIGDQAFAGCDLLPT